MSKKKHKKCQENPEYFNIPNQFQATPKKTLSKPVIPTLSFTGEGFLKDLFCLKFRQLSKPSELAYFKVLKFTSEIKSFKQ